jgi:mono/diheme cytochrome c family protein
MPQSLFWAILGAALCCWPTLADAQAVAADSQKTAGGVPADHAQKMARGMKLFDQHIQTLLTKHCVACHGGKKNEGDLDLTTREGLLQGGDTGPAIVAGQSGESLLMALVSHREEPTMPFEEEQLPAEAVAQLAAWIDCGAPYTRPLVEKRAAPKGRAVVTEEDRKFWSFAPLAAVTAPAVEHDAWCRTPIDRFVLAALEARKLAPNGPAERRRMIRRAYLDLLGLPPSPEEVEAFVADPASDAYERLVDRLLASPHYGERWGRHWLDLARYAESHGYEQDYDRPTAFHYRDFVIQALNDDMPYDRFVQLQLAGDELEPDDANSMRATGFLAAGVHATQITANQVEKERYDELDDMSATVGTAMLGLTIGCARCHDHKFDPIPQSNYYRFLSTFTTTVRSEPGLDFHPEIYRRAKAEFDRQHDPLVHARTGYEQAELASRMKTWLETGPKANEPAWQVPEAASIKATSGATFGRLDDGSYLVSGASAKYETYTLAIKAPAGAITAVRLEALGDPELPNGGPGRGQEGTFTLSEFSISASPPDQPKEAAEKPKEQASPAPDPVEVPIATARATSEEPAHPIWAAFDRHDESGWSSQRTSPQPLAPSHSVLEQDQAVVFELARPASYPAGWLLTFTLKFSSEDRQSLGRFRLAFSDARGPHGFDDPTIPQPAVDEARRVVHVAADKRTDAERQALAVYYRSLDPKWQRLDRAVFADARRAPKQQLTKVLVCTEGLPAIRLHTQGADFFDKTYFLKRGDLNQKQGEAAQGFLEVLTRAADGEKHWQTAPPPGWRTSYRRLALARWITDVDQGAGHLLARVMVNRLWQHHLGRGIVATPSDFGAQAEPPTHPELLDWLARELIASGWRLKSIHKLIMTSSVYRQTPDVDPRRLTLDPDNKLLWRWAPHRLEAEAIRDSMLAVSGLLDRRMFGPGSLDEAQRRRSIYFTIKRSQMIPLMSLFDGPDALQGLGARSSTTVAPQALALMNHPQVQACAAGFAERLVDFARSSPAEAVRQAYAIALARPPQADELADSVAFLSQQAGAYRSAAKNNADQLALVDLCQALLCLNEFIYVE